ncbi:MAG: DedA family protein [Helicobacteraceae bacterium]|jgi:membrane protein DedA with SNARE-associated domain|nr:DedA family protein [Helicobacteraceae bacterium]
MLDEIINFIVNLVAQMGYAGIFIMMFLESSFFPFPSEVAIIPAGYLVSKGEMNLYLVIFCAIAGSLCGALFNYYLAVTLGRKMLIKYGHYVFFTEKVMKKVEDYFAAHGHISTFSGRLIPVVRQYISLPAGLAKMNIFLFSFFTALGAGIWVIVLALLGYFLGANEEVIKPYLTNAVIITIIAVSALIFIYFIRHKNKREKNRENRR